MNLGWCPSFCQRTVLEAWECNEIIKDENKLLYIHAEAL